MRPHNPLQFSFLYSTLSLIYTAFFPDTHYFPPFFMEQWHSSSVSQAGRLLEQQTQPMVGYGTGVVLFF